MKRILGAFLLLFPYCVFGTIYDFSRLDNTHGLSNNQIESIFRDSRGFMWFGTNYGLNRYDGYRVKVYKADANDSTSLKYNAIPEIQEDFRGNLWIKGNPDYVVYNASKESFERNLQTVVQDFGMHEVPYLVDIDKEKNFYFYVLDVGVFKYNVKDKQLQTFIQGEGTNALSKGQIVALRSSGDSFWVLYRSGLLERYNETTSSVDFRSDRIQDFSQASSIPKNLFIDREGCPWVYPGKADKGVFYYDFARSGWIYFGADPKDFLLPWDRLLTTDFVRDVCQDDKGNIWIGTDHGGINIFHKKDRSMTVLLNDPKNPNSISQNSVISLHADDRGVVWVGTYKYGVSYYQEGMFKFRKSPLFFYENPELECKDCNSLYEDSKGNLWIGTNGSGLLKYDMHTASFKLYRNNIHDPASLSSDIVISALEDHAGTMWFGTFLGGLNAMRKEEFIRYEPQFNNPHSLSNKSVYGLVEDVQHCLWVATLGGGLDRIDATRSAFNHFNTSNTPGLSSDYVLSLFSHNHQAVYISTSAGVDVLNTQTHTITPVFDNSSLKKQLSDLVITYTLLDSRNLLWIATDNGINIYNQLKGDITHISKENGLPSEQVVSLIEDNHGDIWVGTRNGLACVKVQVDTQKTDYDYSLLSFDVNDGLVNTIFNQNAVFKNNKGELYFGGTQGYSVFNPDNIHYNNTVPVPQITGLQIGNTEITPGKMYNSRVILDKSITHTKKLVLKYHEKNFTLFFSALGFIHPEKNQYRYMLKGLDKDWITGRSAMASYSNLSPGTYQLIVYASNNDNVWCDAPVELEIVIEPPFWFSWWAWISYFLLAALGVWLLVKYNLRKQKRVFVNEQQIREARQLHEMDEIKFRFFTNISHEFRTPLTLILNPAEKLMSELKDPHQLEMLGVIRRNAVGLLDLVNKLLDFRKLDVNKDKLNLAVGDVVSFVQEICYSFTDYAHKKSIHFIFTASVPELRMEFDPEKLRKITSNLLSNAFKFTPESGKVEVRMSLIHPLNEDKKLLQMIISDTGIGIPQSDLTKIFDRFYRVENPANSHFTGTGVGLHIVNEYVKLHEGEISVVSTEGAGSTFTLTIPARMPTIEEQIATHVIHANQTETDIPEKLPADAQTKNDKKNLPVMLLVDDNDDFITYMVSIFQENYQILTAADGQKALEISLKQMPDLIISDVMMPVMDGLELCNRLKQDIRTSHIPIILLTAKAGDENKYRGIEAGAEDYIAKPFKTELLLLKVSRIIERQKLQHEQFRKKIDIRPTEIEIVSMDEKFVAKAVDIVEKNIANSEFLVEDLCREMGMSRVYFYKKILALTDKTPSGFIRFIRLKRAASLLEKSQLFVNEVAYQVGFNDPKYFRKYFKEEFGMSPNAYKNQYEK